MYRYSARKRKRKSRLHRLMLAAPLIMMGLSGSSFAFIRPALSTSYNQATNARVFTTGLEIHLDRSSPAFAAMEDTWMADAGSFDNAEENPVEPQTSYQLGAGQGSGEELARKISRENRREQSLMAQERAMREANARALAQAAVDTFKKMAAKFEEATDRRVAKLPVVEEAKPRQQAPIVHPTRTISLTDLKMSREELIGALVLPMAAATDELPTDEGMIISGGVVISRGKPVPKAKNVKSAPIARSREVAALDRMQEPEPELRALKTLQAPEQSFTEDANAGESHQVVIGGPIEFTGGLALTNALDKLVVYRESDGELQEAGAVWLREGRYEIFVEERRGILIGELRTPYGDILGRGAVELALLSAKKDSPHRIDPVSLKIRPVSQGVEGRVLAHRSPDNSTAPVKDANIHFKGLPLSVAASGADGRYSEPSLLEGSTVMVRAGRPGYWGTTAFATAGEPRDLTIFPSQSGQMIRALLAHTKVGDIEASNSGIIWGRVTRNGHAVAGAQVDILTTTQAVRPIYFNTALVPDPSLTATSSNGLYAFFPVSPGAHAVQAVINGLASEPLVFPTEERLVSHVDIEASIERRAAVKVFDAFRTDWPLAAQITDPGMTKELIVDRTGVSELRYSNGSGLMILDADSGPRYQRIRLTLTRDRRVIYMPMIQSSWLNNIQGSQKVNREPGAGVIVGFIQGTAPYKVALEEKSLVASSRLIYFNSRGEVTSAKHGEPGGGFILFNVPEGFRTVTVQPSGSTKIYSSVVLVEGKITNVVNHSIR